MSADAVPIAIASLSVIVSYQVIDPSGLGMGD